MSLKRNAKALGLALAAVFAFSAFAVAAAQADSAPRWTVNGVTIGAGAEKNFHAESTGVVQLTVPNLNFALATGSAKGECTATGKIVGSAAGSPGTIKEMVLQCHNVDAFELAPKTNLTPACSLHSPGEPDGTTRTNNLKGTLVWLDATSTTKIGVTILPEVGATFETKEITGATCAAKQTTKISGTIIAEIEETNVDVTEGKLNFPSTAIKSYWTNQTPTRTKDTDAGLSFGLQTAVIDATADIKLTPCELWGVEPG